MSRKGSINPAYGSSRPIPVQKPLTTLIYNEPEDRERYSFTQKFSEALQLPPTPSKVLHPPPHEPPPNPHNNL